MPALTEDRTMNWKLILLLSIFGLVMGFATVSLIPSNIEPYCWLVILIICSYLIAKYAGGKYFLHGLFVSIVNSVWITAVHVAMFYTYIATHPEYIETMNGLPPALAGHPRRMMLPVGVVSGIVSGLILGLFAWIASKILRRSTN
jgi:hypothetical protein